MANSTENMAPLRPLASPSTDPPQPRRTVTFNSQTTTSDARQPLSATAALRPSPLNFPQPGSANTRNVTSTQPMLSHLNSKLRRRNSHGSPLTTPPNTPGAPKIGPQRTTKNAQKLKLLPNPELGEDGPDEESGRDVYSQFTRIKDPTARRDAARLGKADRERLPRVTAYCTASHYRLEGLMRFLKSKAKTRGAAPKQFDECIYSPYQYPRPKREERRPPSKGPAPEVLIDIPEEDEEEEDSPRPQQERRYSDSAIEVDNHGSQRREELIDLHTDAGDISLENGQSSTANRVPEESSVPQIANPDFDTQVHTPEVFLFDYGTIVIWGMTLAQEKRFLKDISKFESEKLGADDVQSEQFNFYYTREYQARIYNDFISLREKKNYMTKLAISHALSQSVKTSLFEDLLSTTISLTHPLPAQLATTGHIALTRREITMQIGALFILRINIHLQGSVLDSPELLWSEPSLDPVYQAVRGYLEIDQRVGLLTERLEVVGDLLAVLREQVQGRHGEGLEWIVIVLIAVEILVAGVNVLVDLWAGGG